MDKFTGKCRKCGGESFATIYQPMINKLKKTCFSCGYESWDDPLDAQPTPTSEVRRRGETN